jgi:hypothetical protein
MPCQGNDHHFFRFGVGLDCLIFGKSNPRVPPILDHSEGPWLGTDERFIVREDRPATSADS